MSFLKILSPAKVNLFLQVLGRREDGFHLIKSVVQPIDLFDEISLNTESGEGIELKTFGLKVPHDESNLAVKAARGYLDIAGIVRRVEIELIKNIPVGAGLGGGSSNAAAVLVGLNRILGKLDDKDILQLAGRLGADVPFFVRSVTSIVEGIGEKITLLRDFPLFYYVVLFPRINLSTKSVYEEWDKVDGNSSTPLETEQLIKKFSEDNELPLLNDLENAAFGMHLGIESFKKIFYSLGAGNVLMSGSGSSIFSVFRKQKDAENVYEYLRVSNEYDVFLTKGISGWHYVLD